MAVIDELKPEVVHISIEILYLSSANLSLYEVLCARPGSVSLQLHESIAPRPNRRGNPMRHPLERGDVQGVAHQRQRPTHHRAGVGTRAGRFHWRTEYAVLNMSIYVRRRISLVYSVRCPVDKCICTSLSSGKLHFLSCRCI